MRLIPFTDQVCEHTVTGLMDSLRQDTLPCVYVDSPGGTFNFFSRMAPAIQRRGIITLAGDVRSAAVLLYILGHRRYATEESSFLFHDVRIVTDLQQHITVTDVENFERYEKYWSDQGREAYQEWRRQMRDAQSWFAGFLAQVLGTGSGQFLKLMHQDVVMDADEARYYGIVHEIVHPEAFEG